VDGATGLLKEKAAKRSLASVTLKDRGDLSDILTWAALGVSLTVLPSLYWMLVVHSGSPPSALDLARHVGLLTAANAFSMIAASRSNDRTDRQIAAVVSSVLMSHGLVAFITLASRIYYSNQLLLISALISAISAVCILLIRQRMHKPKAAVVGAWNPVLDDLKIDFDYLDNPGSADLRQYDIILTTSVEPPESWTEALSKAMMAGRPFRQLAQYMEDEHGVVSVEHFDPDHLPLGGLTSYRVRKRVTDILITSLSLPVVIPVLAVGAVVVLATMGRPVIFVQNRVGQGGRVFDMYKLRTMHAAPAGNLQNATSKSDVRVTPVGRWLRRFRIDELPQLWNVLKGDMSLIGPRPEQPGLTEQYCEALPAFAYRSLVRPGISGWAQVRAGYAANLEETRIKLGYDLFYLKNFSFSLDVQIMLRTVVTLFTGSGVR